jgi:anti-sigma B factor antagonist
MPQTLVSTGSTVGRAATGFPRFDCTLRDGGLDAAWVRVTGELDIATAPQLEQTLRQAEAWCHRVVLDLRQLTFMDSAGVHVIVNASVRANAAGRRLVLVRGPSHIDRVLDLAQASDSLEIVDLDPVEPPVQALLRLAQGHRAA